MDVSVRGDKSNKKSDISTNLRRLKSKKSTGQSSKNKHIPGGVFEEPRQEKQSSSLQSNVKLEGSQSSMRSSIASVSLNASSMMSGKSLLMSKRSSGKKTVLKQVVGFGSDERILTNPKNINKVRLTRYTLISFVPLSLLFQFKRAANIYFLIITILTFLPFTPKDPASMIGTFSFVLIMTMFKEAYEDFQRYTNQKDVNSKKAKVFNYQTEKFEFVKWEQIKAGMIIRLEKDNEIPADIVLLYSSNISGLIFVDTMALDGETNLKEKAAICEVFDEKTIGQLDGEMTVDSPNELLDYWEGFVQCPMIPQKAPCSIKNLALRGSFVRNTKYAYGIVVYTGMQTKILKNLKKPPHKISNVMKKMNRMLYTVFAFQLVLIVLFAGLNYNWAQSNFGIHEETGQSASQATFVNTFLVQILVFWVAYSHLIPISLYVIIEMLKLGQAYLINKDLQMFDKETKSFANCRNSDLIEELGQVEMIFSDKTGTLTMNKMIFKKCQIMGDRIGDANANLNPNDKTELQDENIDGMNTSGKQYIRQKLKEECRRYIRHYHDAHNSIYNYPYMNFVKLLALCHTVVCDIDLETKEIRYQASSPDELALVNGARDFGIELVSRNHNKLELNNQLIDVKEIYKVVAEFPFDSTRKCMSVIVRDQFMKYFLLTKGADSVMVDKISFEKSKNKKLKDLVQDDLSQYSRDGYRTLVMAMRQVPDDEFGNYLKIYTKLVNSSSPYKDKKITELYVKMERKLRYLGCTAIEDKLQEGVPQTIAMIIKADIRFWMLTGDKLETAIEIAKSCKIILDGNQLLVLSTNDFEILNRTLDSQIEIHGLDVDKKVTSLKNFDQQSLVIAIDGSTLNLVLEDPELEQKFFYVSLVAKSVICCRVSPKQKADIVTLYKKRGHWVTLSVGDGANDVSMILEANIGIGIKGKEGTQAVRNADYAISQFKYIQKLLMVHGHWGYRRVSKMICYYFYKNVILVFTEIYFATYNGFSGQIFFADWLPMLYNAFFTSWPCLLAFNFEQDINPHFAYKYPVVYKTGQQGKYFSFGIFWRQILLAIWHGIVCFHIPIMSAQLDPSDSTGLIQEHWFNSTMVFTFIIHIVSYKLFLESNFWNIFSFLACVLCVALYYFICIAFSIDAISAIFQNQLDGVMMMILQSTKFWVLLIIIPPVCLLPDFLVKHGRAIFWPYAAEKIMIEQKKNPKYSFFENQIKANLNDYLTNIIKKSKSYGQLTSKALSEIEKQSMDSGVLSKNSSLKRLSPNMRDMIIATRTDQDTYFKKSKTKRVQKQQVEEDQSDDKPKKKTTVKDQSPDNDGATPAYKNRNKLKKYSPEDEDPNPQSEDQNQQDETAKPSEEEQEQEEYDDESDSENSDINASNAQLVEVKTKKNKHVSNHQNKRMERMHQKEKEEKHRKKIKNKTKGNETTHQLLNESANQSDNEMINQSVQSLVLKQKLQNELSNKQKREDQKKKHHAKRRQSTQEQDPEEEEQEQEEENEDEDEDEEQELEEEDEDNDGNEDDYYGEEEEGDTQEEERFEQEQEQKQRKPSKNVIEQPKFLQKGQMREQSYKERKKRLMENIRKEQQQQKESEIKFLQASYHSTKSNNKMAMSKLDWLSIQAEKKRQKQIHKNTKRAVKDHIFGNIPSSSTQANQNAVILFNSQSSKTEQYLNPNEIPYMIQFQGYSQVSDTTTNIGSNYFGGNGVQQSNYSNFNLPPDRLRQEGHPLEKGKVGTLSSLNRRNKKPKKYVEKYREQITALTNVNGANSVLDNDQPKPFSASQFSNNQEIMSLNIDRFEAGNLANMSHQIQITEQDRSITPLTNNLKPLNSSRTPQHQQDRRTSRKGQQQQQQFKYPSPRKQDFDI